MRTQSYTPPPPPPVTQADWHPAETVEDLKLRFDTRSYAEPFSIDLSFDRLMAVLGNLAGESGPRLSVRNEYSFLGACGVIKNHGSGARTVTPEGYAILEEWRQRDRKCA